jgi:hypothetical protein
MARRACEARFFFGLLDRPKEALKVEYSLKIWCNGITMRIEPGSGACNVCRRCPMANEERVVARFNDGRVLKGYTKEFEIESDFFVLDEVGSGKEHRIAVADLKALFFIKSFEGNKTYREKKAFGISANKGHKVYIKFNDRESLVGFVEGDVLWDKGFFLSKDGSKAKGFFMIPVDSDSNNTKVFVVGSSVKDVTVMKK